MKRQLAALAILALFPAAVLKAQQTASTTFRVSARVNAVCDVTASDLDFGVYSAQSSGALLGTTLVRATCTPNTGYQIGLSEGTAPGATVNQRKMVSGTTSALNYQLYSDSARSIIWGNTPGTDTVTGLGTGLAQEHTVFGAVPAAQSVPAAEYADTITVRIFY